MLLKSFRFRKFSYCMKKENININEKKTEKQNKKGKIKNKKWKARNRKGDNGKEKQPIMGRPMRETAAGDRTHHIA